MKIAITSDIHISSNHKDRLQNLQLIFKYLQDNKIDNLIIAGDLLDKDFDGYHEIDAVANEYPGLNIISIQGNHDMNLDQKFFNSKNIKIYSKPGVTKISEFNFLFLPYTQGKTMGEVIEDININELQEKNWVLVSHGDYGSKNRQECGNEDGYFPLVRSDIIKYAPYKIFLGHIHKPQEIDNKIVYPGSPFPMDINETGQRRLVLFDASNGQTSYLHPPFIPKNLHADIFIIPDGNEIKQVENQLSIFFSNEKEKYVGDNFYENLTMRIKIIGYSTNREGLEDDIKGLLKKKGILINKIDLSPLKIADNSSLNDIALIAEKRINELDLDYDNLEELKKLIKYYAYEIIYC